MIIRPRIDRHATEDQLRNLAEALVPAFGPADVLSTLEGSKGAITVASNNGIALSCFTHEIRNPVPGWHLGGPGCSGSPIRGASIGDGPRGWGSASPGTPDASCQSVVRKTRWHAASIPASLSTCRPIDAIARLTLGAKMLSRSWRTTGGTPRERRPREPAGLSTPAVGCSVTFKWRIHRVPTSRTTKT